LRWNQTLGDFLSTNTDSQQAASLGGEDSLLCPHPLLCSATRQTRSSTPAAAPRALFFAGQRCTLCVAKLKSPVEFRVKTDGFFCVTLHDGNPPCRVIDGEMGWNRRGFYSGGGFWNRSYSKPAYWRVSQCTRCGRSGHAVSIPCPCCSIFVRPYFFCPFH
jgi:hypothetical protein